MFFGAVYAAMDLLQTHHAFSHHMGRADYTYFSVTTLTTVGYGDITAVTSLARRLAMIEAITGQMFLATAMARLMSVARFRRRGEEPDTETG
jgi:voltage-gated potassium channel Kch